MRRSLDGKIVECTPPDFYVRTTVHEYGGAAYTVNRGIIYFSNYRDQHLYAQRPGGRPQLLAPGDGYRFADMQVDTRRRLVCVREDHNSEGEAVNTIVAVSTEGGDSGTILVQGNDFYASPRLSPDGSALAYLTWNHPNMPWDGCELWVADIDAAGQPLNARLVAGGKTESIFQPAWSPGGVLHFVAEPTGWWNLYRWINGQVDALCQMEAEFGAPQWVFGQSTYAFMDESHLLCAYVSDGIDHLGQLDTATGRLTKIEIPFTEISDLHTSGGHAYFLGGSPMLAPAVLSLDPDTGSSEVIRAAFEPAVGKGYFSQAEPITFATSNDREAHGIYYRPRNKDFQAPQGEKPPLLVMVHGGPTSAASTNLDYRIQYWTSRGFAVLYVNYGGSTGYGREYRMRLNGNWGIIDVEDCCSGALDLADRGEVDRERLAIRGGSAGGFTTLACLVFRDGVFRAGASYFGLAELERFVQDTHKFESHYLQTLVGPYPERADLYRQRSPIHRIEELKTPLILFQGDEDKIVPPSQSEMMYAAVREKGLPVAYLLFEGEQHGFRGAAAIKRSLEAELYFYGRVFRFQPADAIEPVEIPNL
jgi:dipeptidyl aminopeptidase/acylaminoacyl peptidase